MEEKKIGGEHVIQVGDLQIAVTIGTVDKHAKSSVNLEFGIWVTPQEEDLIKTAYRIEHRFRRKLREVCTDNLGGYKLIIFNLEYSESPQTIGVGFCTYIRFECTILFNDGDTFDHLDLRFDDMAEELVQFVCDMDGFDKLKHRPTKKQKAA